ncbi:MBL fold metallo-hydrolase [Mucilaginibacter lacusdianchii]|uniref:MBL fold metallo-hydrolase n=1 Tax=Mucilaginibacter lacusdianchii TaxID=2684211 RepID=UPI00131D4730|nr:MBL fold metallo-hydrolase [Mucilaginibacter sp. JXJ CY 39]
MALFITSLNSGSNGNCYYVGNHREAVLIDVGISCREVEKRMLRLGLNIRKVKAIFVSHEHSDHIRGIAVLSKKYQLPVYITTNTLKNCSLLLEYHLVQSLKGYEEITIGDILVTAFPKFHDAAEPHSFLVSCKDVKVGIFTDIGAPCEHLIRHFKQCHAAFLEANYDEQMLATGHYPYHLKRRISGGHGHLSNRQALELFKTHKPLFMSHLLLSHLSKDNNCPNLASELFNAHAGGTQIIVASRYEETPVYHIQNSGGQNQLAGLGNMQPDVQFSLF